MPAPAAIVFDRKGLTVRSDLLIATIVQGAGYAIAIAAEAPDFTTKVLGILAGASFGALVAAVLLSDNPTTAQRIRRFIAAFGSGAVVSLIVLWMQPGRAGIDPKEFVIVVAFFSSFFGWRIAEKLDKRAEGIADGIAAEIAARLDSKIRNNRQDGRVRPVPLVLLGGMALLAFILKDPIALLWFTLTGWL